MSSTAIAPVHVVDVQAGLVDALVGVEAMISALTAAKATLVDQLRSWSEAVEAESGSSTSMSRDLAARSLRAEVACALRIPERAAEDLLGFSRVLVRDLPRTHEALRLGEMSGRHARVVVDESGSLSGEALETYDRMVAAIAATSTPTQLARRARTLRESLDAQTITERAARAFRDREVTWKADRDGMGWLTLYLPVERGMAIMSRATDVARTTHDPDDDRTLAQKRVDVMANLLQGGSLDYLGGDLVRADVAVTVPVFSLMGLTDEPAILEGYGPIPAELGRRLAAAAPSFTRLLIHPHTGVVLSVDREQYRPPADLRRATRIRDRQCCFVGCTRPAAECDLDHSRAWIADGSTAYNNLAHLCRGHHTVKHHTQWRVEHDTQCPGALEWTSPAGRRYRTMPDGLAWPPEIPDLPPF